MEKIILIKIKMQNYNSKFKIKKITIILIIFNLLIGMFFIFQPNNLEFSKAATFDAPLLPGSDNQYNLGYIGLPDQRWQNGFFSGNLTANNTSIGTTTISEKLTVANGNIEQKSSLFYRIAGTTLSGDNWGQSMAVSGKYAYVATDTSPARVSVVNISNPSSPQKVGGVTLNEYDRGWSIAVSGR